MANATNETIEVRLRWVDGPVECHRPNQRGEGVFLREAFASEPVTVRLAPNRTFPLDRASALRAVTPDGGAPQSIDRCGAALAQADNLASTVVWLPSSASQFDPRWAADAAVPSLVLEGSSTALTARGVGGVAAVPPAAEPAACAGSVTRYFVAADPAAWVERRVERVGVQADGCTRLEAADGVAMTVCVPEEAVPFRAGDAVTAHFMDGVWTLQADRGATLTVVASASAPRVLVAYDLRYLAPACSAHSACGAYAERFDFDVAGSGEPIAHDRRVELRGARLYFGGGEHFIVRPSACGTAPRWQVQSGNVGSMPSLYNLAVVTGL